MRLSNVYVLLLLIWPSFALAQQRPAIDLDPSLLSHDLVEPGDGTDGWSFRVKSAILVTALGYYDSGQDGLFQSHDVGIWQGSGSLSPPTEDFRSAVLLTKLTVPAGNLATLEGIWRKVQLPSAVTLEPGYYAISGSTTTNFPVDSGKTAYLYEFGIGAVDTHIVPGAPGGGAGPSPANWWWGLDYGANVGPMFFLEPIPEPSPTLLSAFPLLWYFIRRSWVTRPKA